MIKKTIRRWTLLAVLVVCAYATPVFAFIDTVPVTLSEVNASTNWVKLNMETDLVFEYRVTSVSTNVVVRNEGAMLISGTYYPYNLDDIGEDSTFTAVGTYMDHKSNFGGKYIRARLISFSGATPNVIVSIKAKRS